MHELPCSVCTRAASHNRALSRAKRRESSQRTPAGSYDAGSLSSSYGQSCSFGPKMRTPDEVFIDFKARKNGILSALCEDQDSFFSACDPASENLCLYGNPDGSWEVALPAEEVPPEAPEPALGVNFARDGMARRDWLSLVAVHSDSWLLAQAFFNGARLNREGREALFCLINAEPTCYEVVSGKVVRDGKAKKRGAPGQPAMRQPVPNPPLKAQRPAVRPPGPQRRPRPDDDEDDDEEEEEENGVGPMDDQYADGEGDPCPNCGRVYRTGEFWIACDFCDVWYDGKCVQMTPGKAQRMGKWRCPACERKNV